jgi:hypothetical protein
MDLYHPLSLDRLAPARSYWRQTLSIAKVTTLEPTMYHVGITLVNFLVRVAYPTCIRQLSIRPTYTHRRQVYHLEQV